MRDLLDRMRDNPAGDWTIRDIETLCRQFRIDCRPPRGGGSHYKIGHPMLREIVTIPFRRPIKPAYIRHLLALVEAVRAL